MPTYDDALEAYLRENFAIEDDILTTIRENIAARGLPHISINPEDGRFLEFIVAASGARLVLEIGTLGGYSGTWIARGLPDDGRLITIEVNPEQASVAEDNFRLAGLAERVDIRVGDAHQLLPELSIEGPFDFIFIDAEKEGAVSSQVTTRSGMVMLSMRRTQVSKPKRCGRSTAALLKTRNWSA